MNVTTIRSWWSAGKNGMLALLASGGASRPDGARGPGGECLPPAESQASFWSGFSRQQQEVAPPVGPDRTIRPLNILVPTDFAASSQLAVDCALRMAVQQPVRLTLLHAIHLNLRPFGPANLDSLKTDLCREALALAEPALLSARRLGVTACCLLEDGPPARAVAHAAQRCAPDLVIMVNSRRRGFSRWLGRGTVTRVVQSLHCPVLVLPPA